MAIAKANIDITIRGGLINVPAGHLAPPIPRYQPNTPRSKKATKLREDHQVPPTATPDPPAVTAEKPEENQPNVPAPTSQSN